ncbi:MAG TPA: secretin N-terminal domain-containing protein [Candidatus Eisenbacteria bacterium]|nr:secretin N-terminal domain-containing protein [Candidatus Eisenbacteria bacterium]
MKRMLAILTLAAGLAAVATPWSAPAEPQGRATFSFKGARAQDALRLIAAQFGVNIVIGKDVPGTLTANLSNVTFAEAVSYVAEATGADYRLEWNVLLVNPAGSTSRLFRLRYLDPTAAADVVRKMLSEKGTVEPFSGRASTVPGASGEGLLPETSNGSRENAVIVTDTPARLERIAAVLDEMDARPRQVAITAKLVETTLGKDEKLGVDWQLRASAAGATLPTTFPFPKTAGSGDFTPTPNPNNQVGGGGPAFPPGQTFPYPTPADYVFGKLSFQEFSVAMDILRQTANTNLVSAPTITTLDNNEAEIVVGTVVPVARYERLKETGTMEISGYDEKKIGVRLLVTPHVADDSTMILSVSPEISEIVEYRGQFNERPVTSTRSATTQVVVKNGETLAIGGLIKTVDLQIVRKVPILGDVPLLGALFTHKTIQKQKVDLMIFVTPHLLGK